MQYYNKLPSASIVNQKYHIFSYSYELQEIKAGNNMVSLYRNNSEVILQILVKLDKILSGSFSN